MLDPYLIHLEVEAFIERVKIQRVTVFIYGISTIWKRKCCIMFRNVVVGTGGGNFYVPAAA